MNCAARPKLKIDVSYRNRAATGSCTGPTSSRMVFDGGGPK